MNNRNSCISIEKRLMSNDILKVGSFFDISVINLNLNESDFAYLSV